MRKNVMKHMMTALLIAAAVPFAKAQVHVGDILCEGDLVVSPADYDTANLTAIGVVFYVDNSGEHGWAVSLNNEGSCAWGGYGEDTNLGNVRGKGNAARDIDGYANTKAILESGGDFPAFAAVDFENGWYLPAAGQLKRLYSNFYEVNTTLKALGGYLFTPTGFTYWSSTEHSANNAWYLCTIGGIEKTSNSFNDCKSSPRWIRSVRNF